MGHITPGGQAIYLRPMFYGGVQLWSYLYELRDHVIIFKVFDPLAVTTEEFFMRIRMGFLSQCDLHQ
jgi:hypothetical protein